MNGADWLTINRELAILRVEDTCGIVASNGRRLLAACVYDNWQDNSVQCHLWIKDKWIIRKGWLQLIFGYAFQDPGRRYIYGLVPGNNDKALKLNKHMGFTVKTVLDDAIRPGLDYVIMQMDRNYCRWIDHGRGQGR